MRVLDVGAGTGALSRYLGEAGCDVVALEGNLDRARAAALRCEGLDNVTVVSEGLGAFEDADGFDLVLVCGVLEYAADALGGGGGAEAFLDRVRSLTRPSGSMALAIENQLGLKYLLGYAEDHLGRPWIGVEGYPTDSAVRTYPRRVLGAMFERAGFDAQTWLYPFPDYKLPSVIFSHAAYEQPDAVDFVDQLTGRPCRDLAHPQVMVCDERRAHRSFIEAGLGPEVANSFLVVASSDRDAFTNLLPDDALAWHFGQERVRRWLHAKVVRRTDGGERVVIGRPLVDEAPGFDEGDAGWLRQSSTVDGRYVSGVTLEQRVLEACGRTDADEVSRLLRAWWGHLSSLATARSEGGDTNPFQRPSTRSVLPPDHVDVNLSNFVMTAGGLEYIDAEWSVTGGADPSVVALRALWYLAHNLVTSGAVHPFAEELPVDGLALELARIAGVSATDSDLERWREGEAEFQAKVTDADRQGDLAARRSIGAGSRKSVRFRRGLPLSRLVDPEWPRDIRSLRRSCEGQRIELNRHSASLIEAKGTIDELQRERERMGRVVAGLVADVEQARAEAAAAHEEVARWQARWRALERRWPIRAVNLFRRRSSSG